MHLDHSATVEDESVANLQSINLKFTNLEPEYRITVQCPTGSVDKSMKALGQELPLQQGAYDHNLYIRQCGSQRFRALSGSHAGDEGTLQVADAEELLFTIPRNAEPLRKAYEVIFTYSANEDPTIHLDETWGSRSRYLDDKDNLNRYWNRPDAEKLHGHAESV